MSTYTVSALSAYIKALFDEDPVMGDVWVEGEVSNCRPAVSGHWYWTVKDEGAQLNCVMWKGQAAQQAVLPEDGRAFVLHGNVSAYATAGRYQLYVDHVEATGVGDLYREFERLKAELAAEGLFDAERKRPLPLFPMRIGVVTSAQAAALRDICKVLARRWPVAEVIVAPTLVQGEGAPEQIVAAIDAIGRAGVDVVIVARGGGSIEDLWAFNDAAVARAIAACPVPVVSGVGHETDTTIADFVADLRAPTPSAAAELATPNGPELAQMVDEYDARVRRQGRRQLDQVTVDVERLRQRLAFAAPARMVSERSTAVAQFQLRLRRAIDGQLRLGDAALSGLDRRLAVLSPTATLARGYAHVQRKSDGQTIRSRRDVGPGTGLVVQVADGSFEAVVAGQAKLFDIEGTA
jgi:exodeoxyribonuclease VII large subunit